jgi:hypothetical protein
MDNQDVIAATRRWLELAVIGLDLCPFAAGVYRSDRVRFIVSRRDTEAGLLDDLRTELLFLAESEPAALDTTLLIHPDVLGDFLQFNDFMQLCDALVDDLELDGEIQVASFHPRYQFADSREDDIENYTNRAPFPILHLLREESVSRAVAAFGDTDSIYENNMLRLRSLGHDGWRRLWES